MSELAGLLTRAVALHRAGQVAEAEALYHAALALQSDQFDALNLLGVAAQQRGDAAAALAWFDRALAASPTQPTALYQRGAVLRELNRPQDALAVFTRLTTLTPTDERVFCHCGDLLAELGRPDEALACYGQALALQPRCAPALINLGNLLLALGRPVEASARYAEALAVEPEHPFLFGHWLHTTMKRCAWAGLDVAFEHLAQGIARGAAVSRPFPVLATPLPATAQRQCAEAYARGIEADPARAPSPPPRGDGRLHIGYFSAGLHDHATAHLTAGVFEHHDRSRFEISAFAFGTPPPGPMRERLRAAFDRFIAVDEASPPGAHGDADVAALARRLGLHIAVDLDGYTHGSRPGVLAQRAAPVQLNAVGFPATMGAPWIDYLLADATLVPAAQRGHFSEKLLLMPHSYQPNDRRRAVAPDTPSRAELGLPAHGVVFCCFNGSFKITPDVFEVWMRLLRQVAGSVLWLLAGPGDAADKLRGEAEQRGVAGDRLVFAPPAAMPQHLGRQRAADLFLDSFHYGAHTTASDALWVGLPVVTRAGETMASRVAASLLNAIGLPELITSSTDGYETLALRLATQPEALAAVRAKLRAHRDTHALFDAAAYTRHLEAAYAAMWRRHDAGLAPDHIVVPAP